MATTYNDNGGNTPNGSHLNFTYTFPVIKNADVKVALNGITQASTKYTVNSGVNPTRIEFNNTSIDSTLQESTGAPKTGVVVRVYRDTGLEDPADKRVVFAAGSAIKAQDLNNLYDHFLYHSQEEQNQPERITDADIIPTAEIQVSKLKDGAARQLLQTDAAGTGVEWTNNVDIPGTLDVTSTAAFDGAVTVGGQATFSNSVFIDKSNAEFKIRDGSGNNKFTVDTDNGNTVIAGTLTVTGDTTLANGSIGNAELASNAVTTHKIANDAITDEKMADDSVSTDTIINASVNTAKLADDAVTTAKIAAGNITATEIADNAVTHGKMADNSVGTAELRTGEVTLAKLAADSVNGTKIADDSINSEHYVDGSIDTAHLADDVITGAKLADNSISSQHILADQVGQSEIADNAVQTSHITNTAVSTAKIADGAVTADKIADAVIVTASEQASSTPGDTSFFTTSASDARYFNISSGDTIKDGQTFPDNDTTIATTAAINDRIIDLVDDVGGFVPIANETSFPNANPDVNNGAGTLISIKALASNLTSNGSGVATISNGNVGNSATVTINGLANSTTYNAGFGMIVETTSTLHTYAFHRQVPKATEVTTVAGSISNVNTVAGNISNVNTVAGNNSNVSTVAGVSGNVTTVAGISSNVTTVAGISSDVTAVAGDATDIGAVAAKATEIGRLGTADAVADMNTLGTSAIVSDLDTCATNITNINNVGGSISNVNTVAGNLSGVNSFGERYRAATNNAGEYSSDNDVGDLYFNTTINALKVWTGSAWVAGVTSTGNYAVVTGNTFTGANTYNDGVKTKWGTGNDLEIYHDAGNTLNFIDSTNGNIRIRVNSTENAIQCVANGGVELYHDNTKKFETSSDGVTFNSGHAFWGDDQKLKLGNSSGSPDLQIFHDGSWNRIQSANSHALVIEADGAIAYFRAKINEESVRCNPDGAVEIFYDNSKKLETLSNGVKIHGSLLPMDGNRDLGSSSLKWQDLHIGNDLYVADSGELRIGTGNDLKIYHTGSHSIINNNTGNLLINADNTILQSADAGETIARFLDEGTCELWFDNSKKFETTSTGVTVTGGIWSSSNNSADIGSSGTRWSKLYIADRVNLQDGATLQLGNDNDSYIYKETTNAHTYWRNTSGNTDIDTTSGQVLLTSGNTAEAMLKAIANGAVEVYYDNSKKLETTSTGVAVTGTISTTGTGGNITTPFTFKDESSNLIANFGGAAAELYYNGSKKLETTNTGISVTGKIEVSDDLDLTGASYNALWDKSANALKFYDSAQVKLGTGDDVTFYHDGSNTFLNSGTGYLLINNTASTSTILRGASDVFMQTAGGEQGVVARANGAVELYYDNAVKASTYANGLKFEDQGWLIDNKALNFGTDGDAKIYETGSKLWLDVFNNHDFGIAVGAGNEYAANFASNGPVDLYFDNSLKFKTTANGVQVNGDFLIDNPVNAGADIFFDASENWMRFDDMVKIQCGNSGDLEIYHDGGSSWILNNLGHFYIRNNVDGDDGSNIYIQAKSGETSIACIHDDAVKLYYDGALKASTTSVGFHIDTNADLRFANGTWTGNAYGKIQQHGNYLYICAGSNGLVLRSGAGNDRWVMDGSGHLKPMANNSYDIGTSSYRVRNLYVNDAHFSNKGSQNSVDGTWGDWTLQEGEDDIFMLNNRTGKKYKMALQEVS